MSIKKEILNYSYQEHLKRSKELARILPLNHPVRVEVQKSLDEIVEKLHEINEIE